MRQRFFLLLFPLLWVMGCTQPDPGSGFDAQGIPLPPDAAVGVRPPGRSFDVVVNDRGQKVYLNSGQWFAYWQEGERRRAYCCSPAFVPMEAVDRLSGTPGRHRPAGWNYGRD